MLQKKSANIKITGSFQLICVIISVVFCLDYNHINNQISQIVFRGQGKALEFKSLWYMFENFLSLFGKYTVKRTTKKACN